MLALAIDLLRHISLVYISQDVSDFGLPSEDFKDELPGFKGIVLIDEIDVYLHPTWQREIALWLKHHFPRVQFIVATHSSFIPQIADDNGLFTLRHALGTDAVQVEQEETSVQGWRADRILSILFDTPSMYDPETEQRLREYGRLKILDQVGRLSDDQAARFAELRQWVERYLAPSGDTREEMQYYRDSHRRVQELSKLFREQNLNDKD